MQEKSHSPETDRIQINQRVLQEANRLTQELERLGFEPRPGYRLEHPLGGRIISPPPQRLRA